MRKENEGGLMGAGSRHALGFILMFCVMASLALVVNGRLFGLRPGAEEFFGLQPQVMPDSLEAASIRYDNDRIIVNTTEIAKEVTGYAGPVPVEIYITGNRIDSVCPLENDESESFFARVTESGLTHSWDGLTLEEALDKEVDGVSGATYSSDALIGNVRAGINKVITSRKSTSRISDSSEITIMMICIWVVLAMAAILPLFVRGKVYRIIQEFLNVGILGFWSGTFLDYSIMLNVFANGLPFTLATVTTWVLLFIGFVYPILGKKRHYCLWVCPFGSLQDLAGSLHKHKLRIGKRTNAVLVWLRRALWVVLLLALWIGWGAEWIDYEIFTGFIVQSASRTVIWVGLGFVVLSVIVARPFCRFVCPMGTFLRKSEGD